MGWSDRGVVAAVALCVVLAGCAQPRPDAAADAGPLDVVLTGGRVIDPETGLDAVRDVGIRGERIVAISERPLRARLRPGGTVVDARGLVVVPGFIDLHAHGQSDKAFEYRARDGVTTALELETGYPRLAGWLAARAGKARIHYGASVSHGVLRAMAMPELRADARAVDAALARAARAAEPSIALDLIPNLRQARDLDLAESDTEELYRLFDRGLREGGLGIGMAHQYYPGASRREIYRVFEFAASRDVPIFTHVRSMGVEAMQEVIANAAATGVALHIVHANSMSGGDLPLILRLIEGAAARGVDVTTEAYPYTAASTSLESALFDDGWKERLSISYGDLQWQDTGERLTAESFAKYREEGGIVIIHFMPPETIELAMRTPFVMVASDAMPYAPGAHPRSAGTFARVLGRYVRDQGVLDLPTAVRKMTLLPAQRLEGVAPALRQKGRVQVGADADLVVFDPDTVIDRATYEDGLRFSTGIRHVLVAGTVVVRDEQLVEGAFPGRPVLGRYARR